MAGLEGPLVQDDQQVWRIMEAGVGHGCAWEGAGALGGAEEFQRGKDSRSGPDHSTFASFPVHKSHAQIFWGRHVINPVHLLKNMPPPPPPNKETSVAFLLIGGPRNRGGPK